MALEDARSAQQNNHGVIVRLQGLTYHVGLMKKRMQADFRPCTGRKGRA
jgi:hypothetical protein